MRGDKSKLAKCIWNLRRLSVQNIQRPWRHKVENTAGPPHASGLVEQERKKCEHAIRGEET